MKGRMEADRQQWIDEFLSNANTGCLLIFVLCAGLPIAAIGGFFIFLGLGTMRDQARLHDTAITVPATIVSSEVRQSTTNTNSSSKLYWADIEFTYVYEGKVRSASKVRPLEEGGTAAEMRAIVDRYPHGMEVSAFVDPADPDTAFLERRWSQMPYVAVSTGCLPSVFVTALGILVAGWKRPGIAMFIGLGVGAAVILLLIVAGQHYLEHFSSSEHRWWIWLVLVGAGAMTLGLFAAMIKARQLHRRYLATSES